MLVFLATAYAVDVRGRKAEASASQGRAVMLKPTPSRDDGMGRRHREVLLRPVAQDHVDESNVDVLLRQIPIGQ